MWALFLKFLAYVGIYVAAELLRPKMRLEDSRPAGLGDFTFPTATEGRPLPLVWGTVRIDGSNVVWYGDYRSEAVVKHVRTGIFSTDDVVLGYRYYVGLQMAMCQGPVDNLVDIWVDGKRLDVQVTGSGSCTINLPEFFEKRNDDSDDPGSGIVGTGYFYNGTTTQDVDDYLAAHTDGTVPAYRGTCYFVWEGGWLSRSTNIAAWSFEVTRIPDGLQLATYSPGDQAINDGKDANPLNVLYEILTNTDWGLSVSPTDINTTNFRAQAATVADEGNGFSLVVDSAMEAGELIREIERQIDGQLYFNQVTQLWEVALARADYDPGDLPLFDDSNVLSVDNYARSMWWETTNEVRLQYIDRSQDYNEKYGFAQDMANNIIQGGTVSTEETYPGVKVAALANQLAWRDLRVLSYPLAKLQIRTNRAGSALLPGNVFRFSNNRLGIAAVVFRVTKLDNGSSTDAPVTVWAVQDVFALGTGVFLDPQPTGWTAPVGDYAVAEDVLVLEAPRQLVRQDPVNPDQLVRLWLGARHPGGNVDSLHLWLRQGTSRPLAGSYGADSYIGAFLRSGSLRTSIPAHYTVATRPADQYVELDGDLTDLVYTGTDGDVTSLLTLAYVDGEYIGYERLLNAGSYFQLYRLYRGLFHTAPRAHTAGATVWLLGQSGGGLTRTPIVGDEVDTQLRSVNRVQESTQAETPVNESTLQLLHTVPLAPRDPVLGSTYAPGTASVDTQYATETGRTGYNACALKAAVTPRSWLVDDVTLDHVLPADYLDDDPEFDFVLTLGSTAVGTVTISGSETPTAFILRNSMIIAMGLDALPSTGQLAVTARHTAPKYGTVTNPVDLELAFTVTSGLQGQALVHGGLTVNVASSALFYGETGSYNWDIGTALPSSGIVEININAGGWSTLISAGNSTGTSAISDGDSVQLRFTQAPTADQFFTVTGPTSEQGYGVLRA